jgi:hypothetical protein
MELKTVNPGLCATCLHCKLVRSDKGSAFYRCTLSDRDPRFAKYPRLPVLTCRGWERTTGGPDQRRCRVTDPESDW